MHKTSYKHTLVEQKAIMLHIVSTIGHAIMLELPKESVERVSMLILGSRGQVHAWKLQA